MLKRRVSETTLDTYAPRMSPADLLASLARPFTATETPAAPEQSEATPAPFALNR